jgi:uncharacterized protein YjdB
VGYAKIPGALAAAIFLVSCGSETIIDDSCFVDLAPITPNTHSAVVGDTVTFEAALGPAECLPAGVDPPEWRWYSLDTLIVKIDSLSGLATAVGPGLGPIRVEHARERSVQSHAFVEVTSGP